MKVTNFVVTHTGKVLNGSLTPTGSVSTFSLSLLKQIDDFCERIEQDAGIHGAIITGTGSTFSIGSDIAQIERGLADGEDFRNYLTSFNATMHRLEALPVPTIAAVNGLTRAGGLEIVLACDLALIAEDARIGDGHAAQFAIPAGGSTQRLPRRIGVPRAKELIWSGRFLSARESVEWGLCHQLIPGAELMKAAETLMASFVDKPRQCLSQIKSLIARSGSMSLIDGVELEVNAFLHYARSLPFLRNELARFKETRRARTSQA